MGRPQRAADGGYTYHVLNRANARLRIFEKPGDYEAFEKALVQAVERAGTRTRKRWDAEKVSGTVFLTCAGRLVTVRLWVRPQRAADGGYVYQVLNRANARLPIFEKPGDIEAFEKVLVQAVERAGTRLLAYCLMPNHWHLLVWPRTDGEFFAVCRLAHSTHTQRWHAHRRSAGSGHLYQGRFKSFPVQEDEHFFVAARYVERNALRAGLVDRAEQWEWGSLFRWLRGSAGDKQLLATWPLPRKPGWVDQVNTPQTEAELQAVRRSVLRGSPLGEASWSERTVRRLSLESTLRPQGRPRKQKNGS